MQFSSSSGENIFLSWIWGEVKVVGIGAPMTGSGKTTLSLSLLSALRNSVGVKIGPDYIDAGILSAVSGRRAWNIDRWIQGRLYAKILPKLAGRYDYGVVEGVMGLYDSGFKVDVSTMYYFRKLKIPYILVIDVSKLADSAYHIAKSFITPLTLGVILNRYGSEKHLEMVTKVFESHNIKILGAIPADRDLEIEERHLGLKTGLELTNLRKIAEKVSNYVDLSFTENLPEVQPIKEEAGKEHSGKSIWIAYDKAFNFYYSDSIEVLENLGRVHYFSPILGEIPENPDFIYIGGGYPELYSEELSSRRPLLKFIRDYAATGGRILAECGGLMYLEREIEVNGKIYEMSGVFQGRVKMGSRPVIGYTELSVIKDSLLFRRGDVARGHEFHYSTVEDGGVKSMKNIVGRGIDGYDGRVEGNVLGSYSHFSLSRYSRRLRRELDGQGRNGS
ncbi:MAG: cobyrinate a,c-diamide synthase [Thermoplasmata archaeon]